MNVMEAIETRHCCRSFSPQAPSRGVVEAVLADAARAPSAVNLQPWRVWVAGGEELDRLREDLVRAYRERGVGCSPGGGNRPPPAADAGPGSFGGFLEILAGRGEDFATFINEGSCRLYGAPVGVFCFLEPGEPPARLVDCGLWLANLLLSAHARGVAACPIGILTGYADIVRDALFVPEEQTLACAAALGHEADDAVNRYRSPRRGTGDVEWVW